MSSGSTDRLPTHDFDLLQKTELRIVGVGLSRANLTEVAAAVAGCLGLDPNEVLVIDARDDLLTLDILRRTINPYEVVGRQASILAALGKVPGVTVTEGATVESDGLLGWIAMDEAEAVEALDRSLRMAAEIERRIARRAIVFSTGPEVTSRQIEDTNKPLIQELLTANGFAVTLGEDLADDIEHIAAKLAEAIHERGFGLVVTTGGVGAEAKDRTIEALLAVDPQAVTPYVCRFEQGTGRHEKDGVRIGVGQVGRSVLVALPGPNAEARLGMAAVIQGLAEGWDKERLAAEIAQRLREHLREKMHRHPKHGRV
jgi:molybdenum cofactor synthesis domain-containing protein